MTGGIDSYSTTTGNNNDADGGAINWRENQFPSTVNNSARRMLTDQRNLANDIPWFNYGTGDQDTATHLAVPSIYASATSFTITGADVTAVYHGRRRVRAIGATTGTIYGSITASSYNAGNTTTTVTVAWDSGALANETLNICIGIPFIGSPLPGAGAGGGAVAFRCILAHDQTIAINNGFGNNGGWVVKFDQTDFDTDNQIHLSYTVPPNSGASGFYNPQSVFVCTVSGYYYVVLTQLLKGSGTAPDPANTYSSELNHWAADGTFIEQFDSITSYIILNAATGYNGGVSITVSALVNMNAGEILAPGGVRTSTEMTRTLTIVGGLDTYFYGFLVNGVTSETVVVSTVPSSPSFGSGISNGLKIIASSNTLATVTANSLSVGTSGITINISNVNVTADISTAGKNGLDTGAVAASTWYAVWVIYNADTVTKAALLSLSATTPTLPAGYAYAARVGWVRTDASAHLLRTLQYGSEFRYTLPPLPTLGSGSVGSIGTGAATAIALANFVPSTASAITVVAQASGTNGTVLVAPNTSYGAWNSATNAPPLVLQSGGSASTATEEASFILESTNIYWASQGASNRLQIYGYTDNL